MWIADREVDPDAVDTGADLGRELGVDDSGLLEGFVLLGADDSIAAFLVEHGRAQSLPASALASLLAGAATDADVHGEGCRQSTAQQVSEPRRIGVRGRGPEMEDLLDRPVGVSQPTWILARVDPAGGAIAARADKSVPDRRRPFERGGVGDLAGGSQRAEVALVLGCRVKALPEERERLRTVERVRVDAGRAQRSLDL